MIGIRAVIVDDEPLAREALREVLIADQDLELVGEYRSSSAFLADLPGLQADVVFLDVEMPRISGLQVANEIRTMAAAPPAVVFVTAFDRYAVRAFDEHATDYLLKPVEAKRVADTLSRVRRRLFPRSEGSSLLLPPGAGGKWLNRLAVKSPGRTQLVKVEEVDWIEAAGNYVRLHTGRTAHLFRSTMNGVESRLDPERFVRIHRQTIVNVDRVAELQGTFSGEQVVLLHDGTRLTLSPPFRDRLRHVAAGL